MTALLQAATKIYLDRNELIVDAFAGGGGASTGIELVTGRGPDIAINHNADALAMHARNHPKTVHFVADVFSVDPRKACGRRPVGLFWASPDCTYFSKARGSKPFRDRKAARRRRGLAGVVIRWAAAVRPRIIIMENVEEFRSWGPLAADGRPDPKRRGQSFDRWASRLRNLGYQVEWRELRACDFGAPTTRKRLFIIARCDGAPIVWPQPTHGPGRALPYRTAAECIDWSIPMKSIFGRKTPLAEPTQRRIAAGIRKFVLAPGKARPFYVHTGNGEREGQAPRVRDLAEPHGTVTAKGSQGAVVTPILAPLLTEHANASNPRSWRADEPLRTQCANVKGGHFALVTAFLARHFGEVATSGSGMDEPLRAITTKDHHALVTAQLALFDEPVEDRSAECEAFLVKYFGNEHDAHSLQLPLATVTTKDRFGLVVIDRVAYRIVDIRMRMLTPRELFVAQGFPREYVIEFGAGGRKLPKGAQIEKCGNSVSPPNAAALVGANLAEPARTRRAA